MQAHFWQSFHAKSVVPAPAWCLVNHMQLQAQLLCLPTNEPALLLMKKVSCIVLSDVSGGIIAGGRQVEFIFITVKKKD